METDALLLQIQSTLAADNQITAFCLAHYTQRPTVWLGVDEENAPTQADYPVIVILDCRETRGKHSRERSWSVDIACGIVCETLISSGQTRTYSGSVEAAQLRSLIEAAVIAMPTPHRIETTGESGSATAFPLFAGITTIDFSEHISSR